jgi:sodium transport system permease protein
MNWTNVKLIWQREVRDQLRDRRTVFTIVVLPVLLYPLLGMVFLQIAQFMKEHPTPIRLIGTESLPTTPALIEAGHFRAEFCPPAEARLLTLTIESRLPAGLSPDTLPQAAQRDIQNGLYDAVVYFPAGFAERLQQFRADFGTAARENDAGPRAAETEPPHPEIYVSLANDKSRIAYDRLERVLNRWRKEIVTQNLQSHHLPLAFTEPFAVASTDVSEEVFRRAALWSKLLPFVLVIWALTGAFYPAIDLCAGEKERGTLETLLSSPADRREIVWGKLLTITVFSVATALLNLLSLGLSATFIVQQIAQVTEASSGFDLGPPPLAALGWLLVAVVPIAAMFSAIALAVAAFARSSKEGQYYLMPLLLITLPLMILPMLPTAGLDLGTSLIPVTGMLLLLRVLIEGEFVEALRFAGPVIGITGGCCWLAIRWAVRQFESESVLFRESERFGLGIWLRHLIRDSGDTPSVPQAIFCGIALLLVKFFVSLRMAAPHSETDLALIVLGTQIGLIAIPVLILTLVLTRSPRRTLQLTKPPWFALPAAFLLALTLNPAAARVAEFTQLLYPLSEEARRALQPVTAALSEMPLHHVILLFCLTPAICEEVAFRGFILSGLRQLGGKWPAITLSALFFGLTHSLIQQSLTAAVVGLVIGYITVQSGSLLPGMVFHFTHNAVSLLLARMTPELLADYPLLGWFLRPAAGPTPSCQYQVTWLALSSVLALAVWLWFRTIPKRCERRAA